jgi:type I restriction enzyme M protein
MEVLGRYYTIKAVSNLLVSKFQQHSPKSILDLGVGDGSLLKAAYNRWKDSQFYAVDVDSIIISRISSRLPFANILHIDGLSPNFAQEINLKVGSIDIAVCNPPYHRMKNSQAVRSLLKEAELPRSTRLPRITSDVMFLAQNLKMLREGGELGIILPDSIFTGHEFTKLRQDLLTNHEILGVIQLPDKVFAKTEARTHILLSKKNGISSSRIPLYQSNHYGELGKAIFVSKEESIYRMDYSFYSWKRNQGKENSYLTLEGLNVEIIRGSRSKKELQNMGIQYFHTSSFPDSLSSKAKLQNSVIKNAIIAEPGDILMARVGKRCIGRVTMVESGRQIISDCVYRIRSPKKYREIIWRSLISEEGQRWLKAHAHGVCSQVISKKDLLSFKVEEDL